MKLLPLVLALFAAVPARADWRGLTEKDFRLAPPPAPGSAEDEADMAELLRWETVRTPAQCELARKEKMPDFDSLFGDSGILTPKEMKAAAGLVAAADAVVSVVTGYYKKKYSRPRPYDENPNLRPCADKPGGATSYPSGHAALGAVDACVLAEIFPDRADALTARGVLVGDLRVIGGVHHPSDVAASRTLAAAICARLKSDADFLKEAAGVRSGL